MTTINLDIVPRETKTLKLFKGSLCEGYWEQLDIKTLRFDSQITRLKVVEGNISVPCENINVNIKKTISIFDEMFQLEIENEYYIISHKKWSLIGEGKTILDAENDLVNNAREIAELYINEDLSKLTHHAIQFRDFLFRILP